MDTQKSSGPKSKPAAERRKAVDRNKKGAAKDSPQPPRRGRPPILIGEAVVACLRISKSQAEAIERAARKARKQKCQWMRDALEAAASKLLGAARIESA